MKIIIFYTACTNMLRLPQKPYNSGPHNLPAKSHNPPLAILLFIPQCYALVNLSPQSGTLNWASGFWHIFQARRWHYGEDSKNDTGSASTNTPTLVVHYRHWCSGTGKGGAVTSTGGAVTGTVGALPALVSRYRHRWRSAQHWWRSHRHWWCITGTGVQ
jgi:hypothetical protein